MQVTFLRHSNALKQARADGVGSWEVISAPIDIDTYKQNIRRTFGIATPETERRIGRLYPYQPRTEVVEVRGPNGDVSPRVINTGVEYAAGLIVHEEGIILVAEARFGIRHQNGPEPAITFGPVCGVPKDEESIDACIAREVEEETGCKVQYIQELSSAPIPICGARHDIRCRPFMIGLYDDFRTGLRRPDIHEIVQPYAFTYADFWNLLWQGSLVEESAYITAMLASRYDGRRIKLFNRS